MHSADSARRGQRRRPELNIDTHAPAPAPSILRKPSSRDVPSTPPNRRPPVSSRGKASRALKAAHTSRDPRDFESFLDGITPVDMSNKENDRPDPGPGNQRDSHDLSLSPRNVTRDSLVANMLLSLDQFSMGQMSSGFDDPAYNGGGADMARTTTANSRTRSTTGHGYSYSSDFDGGDDSSRYSNSRGRRSNSSSGFQSSLGRINSLRESRSALHSRGGKGSKSSSTNSIDTGGGYVQVLSSQRWASGFGGRSSSFDYGHRQSNSVTTQQTTQQPTTTQQSSQPWHIEFSNTFFNNDDYDAAPTPTVPGGPRRLPTMPSMPSFPRPEPMADVKSPGLERKRSTRSSRSATVGRQAQAKFNAARDPPPLPTLAPLAPLELDSAPAPHVGYEKAKETVHTGGPNSASQPKEKQGFFRRVFGSSKSSLAALHSSSSPSFSPSTSDANKHVASQMKSSSTPPSRESHHSTHALQKKPSSFFRRRKKSVADAEPPPLPASIVSPTVNPVIQKPELKPPKPLPAQPSPVTSLRKAMNPYLKGSPATPSGLQAASSPADDDVRLSQTPEEDEEERVQRDVRGFSPDYEPDPKATIRSVKPESRGRDITSSGDDRQSSMDTPGLQQPEQSHHGYARTASFLHDNSESEESPKRVFKRNSSAQLTDKRAKSPTSRSRSRSSLGPQRAGSTMGSDHRSGSREGAHAKKHSDTLAVESTDDDTHRPTSLTLPIEGVVSRAGSKSTRKSKSAASLPSVKIESSEPSPGVEKSDNPMDEPDPFIVGDPTEDDRQKAQKIFDGSEEFIQKDKAASWMGEEGPVRQRTLRAYMELYDFKDKSILMALRDICSRLVLRAETQQVDRILVAFSKRWCDCNPNHGFKAQDIIHTICYSIMLLNTDLHLADIESKMTRSQFIKNTMTTIRQALSEYAPDAFERPSVLPGKNNTLGAEDAEGRMSADRDRTASFRTSFKPLPRSGSSLGHHEDVDECGALVKAPFDGTLRAWEGQVESVLKDIYTSIRDERLPLYGAEPTPAQSQNSLSVIGMLKRTPSVLSKTPSESPSSRGRIPEPARASNSRWSSKSRSRPRPFGGAGFSSSRTSFEDGNSMWSPTESSATWSRASLGRTHTSMSMDSFGSSWPRGDFQQSIGFANALSQAIIREDTQGSMPSLISDEMKNAPLLEDESLELAGPPWVKEGIVIHKHHLDGMDKKAKDRNWTEVFAVVQKGQMSIFSFSGNKSMGRSKGRSRNVQNVQKGGVVGGGNWQDNATNLGTFSLRQTLASALPPPGYSRQRPHVWALSLPTGAVHLFQVGTPEISKEFVTTANYWSARLSTHPLMGGVSNIEYGWGESIVNNSLVTAIAESTAGHPPGTRGSSRPGSAAAGAITSSSNGRTSMHSRTSSFRSASSFDFGSSGGAGGSGSRHGKLPGDRIHIAEWAPPTQSMRPSALPEGEQLKTLLAYVKGVEEELQQHNALRSPMLLAFTPRGHNAAKAMANWERKSAYLLREIVKFRTYVDCLQQAEARKREIWKERNIARRAARGDVVGDEDGESEEGEEAGEEDGETERERGEGEEARNGDETLRP
ncbi:Sec7 domain-containing protein [Pleurostoma richardsiae]|uniref:Sec7 domain-containing protein n=1 Tax=Pleurostoma richardsiae TaxID=41990 RepID=A0AA38VTZ9_9PEZI|nr:Sec7 domain-containing protein [Pleurostoma richardsiae]